MKIKTTVKTRGSSLVIIFPKEVVRKEKLRPGDEVIVEIKKKQETTHSKA